MESIKIRKATKADVPTLAEYRFRMFRDMKPERDYSKIKERFIKKSKQYYLKHIGSKDQYDCVVLIGEKIVGCGSILFWDRPPHIEYLENSLSYILNIYVESEYRRKGISRKIMAKLHEEAKKHGMRKIGLHASRFGYPIYKSMGYKLNKMYLELEL